MEKTINVNGIEVRIKTGSEGPSHDPYSYTEYLVIKDGRKIKLHEGIGDWISVDEKKIKFIYDENRDKKPEMKFEHLTGLKTEDINDALYNPKIECEFCGNTDYFEEVPGYPGEFFTICEVCGTHVDYEFYESHII